jgi:hypothetical protein
MAELRAENVPPLFQVVGEGLGLVLREDNDLVDAGVHAVAEGEVHEAIDPAERDSGFSSVLGKGHEPFAPSSSHDKREGIFHRSDLPLKCHDYRSSGDEASSKEAVPGVTGQNSSGE